MAHVVAHAVGAKRRASAEGGKGRLAHPGDGREIRIAARPRVDVDVDAEGKAQLLGGVPLGLAAAKRLREPAVGTESGCALHGLCARPVGQTHGARKGDCFASFVSEKSRARKGPPVGVERLRKATFLFTGHGDAPPEHDGLFSLLGIRTRKQSDVPPD